MKVSVWVSSLLLAIAVAVPSARGEQVVFSKIMYHPSGDLPEYIEVYNNTATPLDIAQWRLSDGVDYVFPQFSAADPGRTFLRPFERVLVSRVDDITLRAAYKVPITTRVYGPWTGSLDNAGERVTLKDKNGAIVCTVQYNNRGQWPVAADGAGHSLVLINPDKQIDDWRNWTFSPERGGTPGSGPGVEAETAISDPEVSLSQGIALVDYGDVWKFNDKNVDLGTAWRSAAYDDTAWSQGPGLLGFETDAVPSPGMQTAFTNSRQFTFYLRKSFVYNGRTTGATLTVDQIVDDGAVYYLNGQELGRAGMPAGTIGFATAASRTVGNAVEEPAVITGSGSALVTGTNVLAAEVHQVTASSSDIVFGMRLNISVPIQSGGLMINEVLAAQAGTGFVEIYNPGSSPVNLRGYYLTSDPGRPKAFQVTQDVPIPAKGLACVGFTESGLTAASPLKVTLVGPDGETIVNAISAAIPLDGRSVGRKPAGGNSWFLFTQPTPNAPNASQNRTASGTLALNEVHFGASGAVDWVELVNSGTQASSLDGLFLCSRPDLADKVALMGQIAAGGFASGSVSFALSSGEVTCFLVDSEDTVLSAAAFKRPVAGNCLQAFPQGSSEWYASAAPTRNGANDPARNTDVVINEIMYHPPSGEPSGGFVELINRGTTAVDLSGWKFVDGIDFTFAQGTILAPGAFLVVAADADWLLATYGAIPVVGNFEGQLSGRGERVRLVDAQGNLADEVDYGTGGNWPGLADGSGSSLELINPWMDNSLASAWSDSDETAKAPLKHYSYKDVYRQLNPPGFGGQDTDSKELHLYLVGESEVILNNIQLRLNGSGANLLANAGRMSTNGSSATGWLAQGTHYATYLDDAGLHLVADGHGDNRPNRVEIDATAMQVGRPYEVSFDARWVRGTSRLIVQTWDHSIATSLSLPVPSDLGTPGRENSTFVDQPAPQIDGLTHKPAVPAPGQTVQVTARVLSLSPAPKVTLYHRLDSASGGVWANKPMFDDGVSGGDLRAGDGTYTTTLTEYGKAGQVVQFYVMARGNDEYRQLPSLGSERPALYVVDSPMPAGDLRRMRFVVSAQDIQAMSGGGSVFPRMSNHYFNMTMVINEKDVVYGCEARPGGSPWLRSATLDRGKFKLPKDNLFRGKVKLVYDSVPGNSGLHHDRLTRYWLYLLGHPVGENEFIQLKVNAAAPMLREEIEPVGNDMLDRVYENGSQGELYRFDDEWWFTDGWGRSYIPADWCFKPLEYLRPYLAPAGTQIATTDNPGRYRTEWIKRTRENEDDYSSLISFFKTVTLNTYAQDEIERLIDPVATMTMCAVRGYIYDWDSFSMQRGKNGLFYRRPADGRFMFFHWDSDLGFQNAGGAFYIATGERNDVTAVRPYIEKPYNFRLFKHSLATLVENFARNSARVNTWLAAEEDASSQYVVSSAYKSWFQSRESAAFSFLGQGRSTAFAITTNGGNTITTGDEALSLSGTASLLVSKVEVLGHPEARCSWVQVGTNLNQMTWTWTLEGILLHAGRNDLTVNALDDVNQVLGQDLITVNKTGNAPPVLAIKADPASWRMSVLDTLAMDVLDSNDPEGSVLTFAWTLTPAEGHLDASGQATATFSHPGLYKISVTGQDSAGGSATIEREVAVYAPQDSTSFKGRSLEPYWTLENLVLRPNYTAGPYYSLAEIPGQLVLQVLDDQAVPLSSAAPQYPVLWRPVPASTDWTFMSKVRLAGQVFADYSTGLIVAMSSSGSLFRYTFGIEDGNLLTVRRTTQTGTVAVLKSTPWASSQAELRIRRTSGRLWFEQRTDEVWNAVHSLVVTGSTAVEAGLFVATDAAQRIKAAFEYATLVDPSAAGSALQQGLRLSEIMFNPAGSSDYEFVELVNIGQTSLDLTGARFTAGIDYTFGPQVLAPGQCIVIAADPTALAQICDLSAAHVAPGGFSGKLANEGETIELSDAQGTVILSVTYGTSAPWPAEAASAGRSLEIIDPLGSPNDPANWRASAAACGSPGQN